MQPSPPCEVGVCRILVPEGEKKEPAVRSFNRSGRHADLFIVTGKKKKTQTVSH